MPIGTGGQAVRAFFEQQPAEPERSTLRSFSLSLLFGSFRFFPIATAAAAAAAATQSAPILQVRRQCGAAAYETGGSADEIFSNFPATFFISVLFIFTRRHPKFLIFLKTIFWGNFKKKVQSEFGVRRIWFGLKHFDEFYF